MAMSDAEIRSKVRALLSSSTKAHSKTENRWGCSGMLLGLVAGSVVNGIFAQTAGLKALSGWILFLMVAGIFTAALYSIGYKINKRRASRLARKFHAIFPAESPEYAKAIALLHQAKTESKIEKEILEALGHDVQFGDEMAKPAAAAKPAPGTGKAFANGPVPQNMQKMMQQAFGDIFSSGFPAGAKSGSWSYSTSSTIYRVPKAYYEKLRADGKIVDHKALSASAARGVLAGNGATIFYDENENVGAPAMTGSQADELLGAFDKPATAAPQPKTDAAATAPASGGDAAKAPTASGAAEPGFIPLDPYVGKESG